MALVPDIDLFFADLALSCTIRQPGQSDIATEILFDEKSVTDLSFDNTHAGGTLRSALVDSLPRKDVTVVVEGKGTFRVLNPTPDGNGLTYVTLARIDQ